MLCLVRLGVHYRSDAFWAGGIEVALFFFVCVSISCVRVCVCVVWCVCACVRAGFACFTMLLDKCPKHIPD